jgi:hypothetical protein
MKLNPLVMLFLVPLALGCRTVEDGDTKMENSEVEPQTQAEDPEVVQPDASEPDKGEPESGNQSLGAQIVINEFMPSNATIIQDEAGGSGDWIELYNLTEASIDLAGYFISDKLDNPTKMELGSGLNIEAGGTLLLWADSDPEQGPAHLSFNLAKDGEAIVLTSPMGDMLDSIDYANATTDSSFARVPDGVGAFGFCQSPTPNAPNDTACAP